MSMNGKQFFYPVLSIFFSAKTADESLNPQDDISEFMFVPKGEVLNLMLAWPKTQPKMFKEYLKQMSER